MDQRTKSIGVAAAWVALLTACPSESGGSGTDSSGPSESTGTDAGSSSGASCADAESQVLFAYEGTLVDPMGLGPADTLGFDVARSLIEEMGTVTLEFTTTCAGPIYMWALLWDQTGGNEMDNADSLYFALDGGEEQTWLYGCSTTEGTDETWWWLGAETWAMSGCDHQPLELELPAGDHTLVIRNREPGAGQNVAALGAVVVSHDPDADPNTFVELSE